MAKLKTNPTADPDTPISETTSANIRQEAGAPPATAPEATVTATPKTAKSPKTTGAASAAEPGSAHLKNILKAFPTYETLYVDSQGGIYSPDTAPKLRTGAILYKNPYYTKH